MVSFFCIAHLRLYVYYTYNSTRYLGRQVKSILCDIYLRLYRSRYLRADPFLWYTNKKGGNPLIRTGLGACSGDSVHSCKTQPGDHRPTQQRQRLC